MTLNTPELVWLKLLMDELNFDPELSCDNHANIHIVSTLHPNLS